MFSIALVFSLFLRNVESNSVDELKPLFKGCIAVTNGPIIRLVVFYPLSREGSNAVNTNVHLLNYSSMHLTTVPPA